MPNWGTLREKRQGICLHYDQSASDAGAVDWLLHDPRCKVSYNWLVLDDGRVVPIAPEGARAWHAGVCKPSECFTYRDANSALYGIAWAGRDGETCPEAAKAAIVSLIRSLYHLNRWDIATDRWRVTGHDRECWPRGRKVDPTGHDPKRPVLDLFEIRSRL